MSEDPPDLTHLETQGQQRSGRGEARWRRAQRLNLRVGQRTPRHGPPAHACLPLNFGVSAQSAPKDSTE